MALCEAQMSGLSKYVDGPWRFETFAESGIGFPLTRPAELNDLLIDFLTDDEQRLSHSRHGPRSSCTPSNRWRHLRFRAECSLNRNPRGAATVVAFAGFSE